MLISFGRARTRTEAAPVLYGRVGDVCATPFLFASRPYISSGEVVLLFLVLALVIVPPLSCSVSCSETPMLSYHVFLSDIVTSLYCSSLLSSPFFLRGTATVSMVLYCIVLTLRQCTPTTNILLRRPVSGVQVVCLSFSFTLYVVCRSSCLNNNTKTHRVSSRYQVLPLSGVTCATWTQFPRTRTQRHSEPNCWAIYHFCHV